MRPSVTILSIAVFFVSVPVRTAFSESPAAPWPVKKVTLIQARDFRLDPAGLFVEGEVPEPDETDLEGAFNAAWAVLAGEPEISLGIGTPHPSVEVTGDTQEFVVRGMLHLGIERYRDIRLGEAIETLQAAIALAQASFIDLLNPSLVADLHLYLGLCLLETGKPEMAHVALKNMFLHAPGRRFRAGWFPEREEKALRAAALDFVESPPRENPLDTTERMEAFLDSRGADALAYMYMWPDRTGSTVLETRVFEKVAGAADRIEVSRDTRVWKGPESASAAISAWLACADLPSRVDTARRLPRLFLDTSFSYSMFATDNTTRTGFHNLGLAVGLAYQVQPGLDVFMKVNVYNSIEDRYGDLLDDFWSLRTSMGGGYSAVFSWGRVFTHFGFEMDYLSGFRSSTDPRCKLWPDAPDLCASSEVSEPSFLFGATGMVGVNVFLSRSVYLTVQVGFSGYFVSSGELSDLNLPWLSEIGLGYAFF